MSDYEFWKELENIFEAVTAYQKKNIEFNRVFVSPWVRLGHVFPHETSLHDELQTALHAAELDPESPQAWTDLGDMFLKSEKPEESADAYRKAIELDPKLAWPKSNLGFIQAAEGRYPEAIGLYTESLQLFTDDHDKALTWNRLGETYRRVGDFDKAVAAFHKADELGLTNPDPQKSLKESNETEDAASGPTSESATKDEMEILNAKPGDSETNEELLPASRSFDLADEIDSPDNSSRENRVDIGTDYASEFERLLLKNLGQRRDTRTDESESRQEPEPGIEDHPFGQLPEAEDAMDKSIAWEWDFPHDTPVKANAESLTFISTGENTGDESVRSQPLAGEIAFEKYLEDLFQPVTPELAVEEKPAPSPAPVGVNSASEAGMPELDSQNPQVWNELGNIYFNSSMFDSAILAYREAIELDSHFALAYSNLALAYAQIDNFDEAVLLYKRSIELTEEAKDKAVVWNRLGNLYRHHQRYDEAIEAYQIADDLDPESVSLALRSRFSLLGDFPVEEPAYL